jgi:hypothetical protein
MFRKLKNELLYGHRRSLLSMNLGFLPSAFVSFGAAGIAGWKELGRSSGAIQLDVSSLPNKRYYMVLLHKPSGNVSYSYYLNTDTNTNYSRRYSNNGSADSTNTSQSSLFGGSMTFGNFNEFMVSYIANFSTKEKFAIGHIISGNTSGAGNAPERSERASKWANTTSAIDRIRTEGTMTDSGSEMVVLGYDPTDTHTDNFWQEIGSGTASGSSQTLDVTLTAKKYNWFQGVFKVGSTSDVYLRVGNTTLDSNANYSMRKSSNGGTDTTGTSASQINIGNFGTGEFVFLNGFWINRSSNEKLFIIHVASNSANGAGNAPTRIEITAKHSNTTNQDDHIGLVEVTGNLNSITQLKVWGAD